MPQVIQHKSNDPLHVTKSKESQVKTVSIKDDRDSEKVIKEFVMGQKAKKGVG